MVRFRHVRDASDVGERERSQRRRWPDQVKPVSSSSEGESILRSPIRMEFAIVAIIKDRSSANISKRMAITSPVQPTNAGGSWCQ